MWRRGREGLGVSTLPAAISAAIREDSGTKTEVSHDEGFISALHRGLLFGRRKNLQVRASLNSRATHDRAFRVGYLDFRAKISLAGCTFWLGLWGAIFSRAGAIDDLTILDILMTKAIMAVTAKGQVGP